MDDIEAVVFMEARCRGGRWEDFQNHLWPVMQCHMTFV